MLRAAVSAFFVLALVSLLILPGCTDNDNPVDDSEYTEDHIIGVWSLAWMTTDSNRVDATIRLLPGQYGWSIRRNGDSLRVKYFSMGKLQNVHIGFYDTDSLWLEHPDYGDNYYSAIHLVPDGDYLRTSYDQFYYEGADYHPDRLHLFYESMPLDHSFEFPVSDAQAQQILAAWDFALYDSLCFELAQLESTDSPDPIGGWSGTRDDWDQLSAYMKSSYLWDHSYDVFDAEDDLHLAYAALLLPEAAGIGWTDWAEGRSLDDIIAALADNDWEWPGGSDAFTTILEEMGIWWRYPERE